MDLRDAELFASDVRLGDADLRGLSASEMRTYVGCPPRRCGPTWTYQKVERIVHATWINYDAK